jgi:hypothetical protein
MRHILFWLFIVCGLTANSHVYAENVNKFKYPFYIGVTGGYGRTTWQGLVPPEKRQSLAMAMSTPKYVNEGGALWGLFAGYEFLPSLALEASYMRYPDAKVEFDSASIFSFERNGLTQFITKTETVSLMGKIMMIIPHTDIRAYSSLGLAEVHRCDQINNHWRGSPTFGAGFNYNVTQHVMGELGAVYTAGFGQAELNPAEDYYPFLYSVFFRLAYRL